MKTVANGYGQSKRAPVDGVYNGTCGGNEVWFVDTRGTFIEAKMKEFVHSVATKCRVTVTKGILEVETQ